MPLETEEIVGEVVRKRGNFYYFAFVFKISFFEMLLVGIDQRGGDMESRCGNRKAKAGLF